MPNIFGKESSEYRYLTDSVPEAAKNLRQIGKHRFDQLGSFHDAILKSRFSDVELVTQAIGFTTNNLEAIQAEIDEVLYLDFRADEWLPFVTNIPEGAQTYAYRVLDRQGRGTFIERRGTNATDASISMAKVPYSLAYGGLNASWTREDLRSAAFTGVGLDTETINAATIGAMDHIETIAINGDVDNDAGISFEGITNLTGVTTGTAAKTILLQSGDELQAFLTAQISAIIADSSTIFGSRIRSKLAFYLPTVQYNEVVTKPYGDNRDKTVWEFVRMNNAWTARTGQPVELREVIELKGAGAAGVDRMITGFPDESKVWEMALPISPRVINTFDTGFVLNAPIEYKCSGVNLKRPAGVRYTDGI